MCAPATAATLRDGVCTAAPVLADWRALAQEVLLLSPTHTLVAVASPSHDGDLLHPDALKGAALRGGLIRVDAAIVSPDRHQAAVLTDVLRPRGSIGGSKMLRQCQVIVVRALKCR
ncbi:uncharacterized protein K452DRAFT_24848 [Aplosporella prunicola CBS 121167]|uniref:Uncharacterized protein n=1 Tax=Aplosporella prunicola CBS 121167 TaxID=1176127 RepID=A0A6A6BFD9_9PEZI|nr:uncharacterized protein K452DRAFT_24848 [Aplosporella prunicola CBS 121167]KAF2142025.1 hypothetical protein K452DRAFT_24848 [Aplosporella prunicola CBS 121167]